MGFVQVRSFMTENTVLLMSMIYQGRSGKITGWLYLAAFKWDYPCFGRALQKKMIMDCLKIAKRMESPSALMGISEVHYGAGKRQENSVQRVRMSTF